MASKTLHTFQDLLAHELRDLYSAEQQIVKALPAMIKSCSSEKLQAALQEHLEVTERQVERLEQVCEKLEITPKGVKCAAMEGLLEEGKEILKQKGKAPDAVLDAAIISAAQRVEHYEIAGYGTVATFAKMLGHEDAAELLAETLDEERSADTSLTELAESEINVEAVDSES
ncbi:MAG: ferritin-like domain-containing protein [Pirellulaceae bacterium]